MYEGVDKAIALLRDAAPGNEIDYSFIAGVLAPYYKSPRVKINHLIKVGALIRLKRGIYLFGERFRKGSYSLEVLANKIYGPSYVSLEWALQYYRLIPERVEVVTSVALKPSAKFETPLRLFTYDTLPKARYSVGVTWIQISKTSGALIATKEKALADFLVIRRGRCTSIEEMKRILFEDMRLEEEDLIDFDLNLLEKIHRAKSHSALSFLIKALKELHE